MNEIRLLDAFAGIGGFHLGVKQACQELNIPFKCVGAIEFDKNARKTYSDNFDDIEMFNDYEGDITKIPVEKIPDHNILTGGFPCQPFSVARKNNEDKAGLNADDGDDRAYLYMYLCKILQAKQPEIFIFENVKGLLKEFLNGDSNPFINTIVKGCENCGYSVCYKVLNAKDFNSPQSRERVYFVGYRKDLGITPNLNITHSINKRYICDILDNNVDDYYLLENLWKKIKNHKLQGSRYDAILNAYNGGKWTEPSSLQHEIVQTARVENDTPSGFSRQRDRVYSSKGISPTLLCTSAISISIDGVLRQLTPLEYSRIQCFPDDFKIPINRIQAYKQFGNAVCVNVVKSVVKYIIGT